MRKLRVRGVQWLAWGHIARHSWDLDPGLSGSSAQALQHWESCLTLESLWFHGCAPLLMVGCRAMAFSVHCISSCVPHPCFNPALPPGVLAATAQHCGSCLAWFSFTEACCHCLPQLGLIYPLGTEMAQEQVAGWQTLCLPTTIWHVASVCQVLGRNC